jgi:hypothetical protein
MSQLVKHLTSPTNQLHSTGSRLPRTAFHPTFRLFNFYSGLGVFSTSSLQRPLRRVTQILHVRLLPTHCLEVSSSMLFESLFHRSRSTSTFNYLGHPISLTHLHGFRNSKHLNLSFISYLSSESPYGVWLSDVARYQEGTSRSL